MRTEPDFLITTLSEREKGVLRTVGTREFVATAKFIVGADEADNIWLIEQIKQLYEQYYARVKEYRKEA